MYYLNGEPLRLDKAFVDADGNQYPANWLRNSTQEQRDALGIVWVASDPSEWYDQRFYWGVENPKDLTELKELWASKQEAYANIELAKTDWYAARAHDTGKPVPEAVATYRTAVRVAAGQRAAEIEACLDVDELAALIDSQPWVYADEGDEVGAANPDAITQWPEMGEVVEYPDVDYRTFYGALQLSSVYATIRTQAAASLPMNVYCTEFIAAIGEAKAGLPQAAVIQQTINDLVGAATLTTAERAELEGLMAAYGLGAIYTLPTP